MKQFFEAVSDRLGFRLGAGEIDAKRLYRAFTRMAQVVTYVVIIATIAVFILGSTKVEGEPLILWTVIGWLAAVLIGWLGFTKVILAVLGIEYTLPKALSLFRKEETDAKKDGSKDKGGWTWLKALGRFGNRLEGVGSEVASDLRKGFGNIMLLLSLPVLIAIWGWFIHFKENDALLPFVVALMFFVLGRFLAPGTRKRAFFLVLSALVLIVFTIFWVASDEESPVRRGVQTVREIWPEGDGPDDNGGIVIADPCAERPEMDVVHTEPGLREHHVGRLVEGCPTGRFSPLRGGWDSWTISALDSRSWAKIEYTAGPITDIVYGDEGDCFLEQWPDFRVIDGEGTLVLTVWDSEVHPGPGSPCD